MADQVQWRRGTSAETATFVGAQGEVTIDTDKDVAVVHDGVTPGGHSGAKEVDITDTTIYFDDDVGGGSAADAYILTPKSNTRTPTNYFDGVILGFTTSNINTGPSTANFVGLGVKNIKLADGTDPVAGQINGRTNLVYDSGNGWFELDNPAEVPEPKTPARNILDNSGFLINQREVVGTVVLLAGEAGHDRWIAGSAGCTYTFAELAGVVTITITSGHLGQVMESNSIESGDSVATWNGTTQGRIFPKGAPSGTYEDSGFVASFTGGLDYSIEFGIGTLSIPKVEAGSEPTNYNRPDYGTDFNSCARFYQISPYAMSENNSGGGTPAIYSATQLLPAMRDIPAVSITTTSGTAVSPSVISINGYNVSYTAPATSNTSSWGICYSDAEFTSL